MSEISVKMTHRNSTSALSFVDINLPMAWSEFYDAMQRARITDESAMVSVKLLYWKHECLLPHIKECSSPYELNLLAQRLSNMSEQELDTFSGMVALEERKSTFIPISRLINLTHNFKTCKSLFGIKTDKALGVFLDENDLISNEELQLLKFASSSSAYKETVHALIGEKHRLCGGGVFTDRGYFEYDGALKEVYIPGKAECFNRVIAPMTLEIKNPEYDGGTTAIIEFPTNQEQITAALEAVKASSLSCCFNRCTDCIVPSAKEWIESADEFHQVMDFAKILYDFGKQHELTLYKALLDTAHCADLETALSIAGDITEYELCSEIVSPEDYAKDSIRTRHCEEDSEIIYKYMNLYCYGAELMKYDNVALTPYGVIRRVDGGLIQLPEQTSSGSMQMA